MGDWESEAGSWIAWARTPGHDVYWHYRDRFFELVPTPGQATLDVGCGEGRVARDLAERQHHVVGIDNAPTLLAAAQDADPDGDYRLADATELPFADSSFDLVVAYNSLMDIERMDLAVNEIARVLTAGGTLCLSVTHPLNGIGRFTDSTADAPYCITQPYLKRQRFEGTMQRLGLTMTFHGWTAPLSYYIRALSNAGFVTERIEEPAAPAELVNARPDLEPYVNMPLFMWVRARI